MPKRTSKRTLKRTPKEEPSSEAKEAEFVGKLDLNEQRERIRKAILPGANKPEDDTPDIDLDADVETEGEESKDDMMGPHRRKQMAPLVQEYIGGLRKMLDNSGLRENKEFVAYGEGLRECTSAGLGMLDILIRKWMGKVPYAEEMIFGATGATVWYGGKYLNERLDADAASRAGGDRKDNPAPGAAGS